MASGKKSFIGTLSVPKTTLSVVGLDIGGTKMEAIFWRGGKIIRAQEIKTPKRSTDFFKSLAKLIETVAAGEKYDGVGIGLAGAMNHKTTRIYQSPNLPFLNGVKVGKLLRRYVKKPIRIDNDARCFLLGEYLYGQARGRKNIVGLILGTGVGGAIIIEGQLLRGGHGTAGELGFATLEDLVKPERRNYQKVGKFLGIALANIINALDPEMIILGGGITNADRLLLAPAKAELIKHTFLPARDLPDIRISKLKHAGALGAVSLFLPNK